MESAVAKASVGIGLILAAYVPAMALSFVPLDDALARLETVTTVTQGTMRDEMGRSLASAREWSSQHVASTSEVIRSQFEMATAGLTNQQSLEGVAAAAQLATASGDQLAESSKFLASLFNTFGEAGKGAAETSQTFFQKTNDALAEVIKRFQVTMVPLREGFSFITAQAVEMGLTGTRAVTEFGVALGIMNTAGLRGSVAGAALQNVFMRLDEAAKKLGVDSGAFTDQFGKITSLSDIFDEIARKLEKGRTAYEQLTAANEAFGIRGAKAAMIMVQQREALRQVTDQIDGMSGSAKKMQDIMERTTGSQLKIAANDALNFAQAVGESLAPAFIAVMHAVQGTFEWLTRFTGASGATVAVALLLTGAVVAVTGALGVYRAVLIATGATSEMVSASMTALGAAMLRVTLIGAVVFAAVTLIGSALAGPKIPDIFSGLDKTNFSPVLTSLGLIASDARRATDEVRSLYSTLHGLTERGNIDLMQRLGIGGPSVKNLDGSVSTVRSMGVGVDNEHVLIPTVSEDTPSRIMAADEALKAYIETGHHLGKFISDSDADEAGRKIHDALERAMGMTDVGERLGAAVFGALQAAGISEAISEQVSAGVADSIGKMRELGVSAEASVRSAGVVLNRILSIGLPATVAENLQRLNGALASTDEAFRKVEGTGESLTQVLKRWEGALDTSTSSMGRLSSFMSGEAFASAQAYLTTAKALASALPDIEKAIPSAGLALREGLSGMDMSLGIEKFSGTQMVKVIDTVNRARAAIAEMYRGLAAVPELSAVEALSTKVQGFSDAFIKAKGEFDLFAKGMKTDITAESLVDVVRAGGEMVEKANALAKAYADLGTAAAAARAKMTAADTGSPAEAALRVQELVAAQNAASSRDQATAVARQVEDMKGLRQIIGDLHLSEDILKVGGKAVGAALSDSLLLGDFSGFQDKLFRSAYKSLADGIAEGAQRGLLAASGLTALFDVTAIGDKIRSAIESAGKPGGGFDIAKVHENLAAVMAQFKTGSAAQLPDLMREVALATRQVIERFAEATGSGATFFGMQSEAAEKAAGAVTRQAEEVAKLQVELRSADRLHRQYLEDLVLLKERSGTLQGVDLGTASLQERQQLLERIFDSARRALGAGDEVTRQIGDQLAKVIAEQSKGDLLEKRFGIADFAEKMDRAQKAVEGIPTALTGLATAKTDTAAMADGMERGRTAAEGIRDAIKEIKAGASVAVGGAGGPGSVVVNMGGTQIVMDVGAAVTEKDLADLGNRLDKEWEQKRAAILLEVRSLR